MTEISERLENIFSSNNLIDNLIPDIDLSMFYEQKTLTELLSLRNYLNERKISGKEDFY